jgi:glycosyltransferase involved in cell wall biosynthesis
MKILFLVPYPKGKSPSQRFRFEQYIPLLASTHQVEQHSFLNDSGWNIIYSRGRFIAKMMATTMGFFRRSMLLRHVKNFDIVFVHREAAPFGPPVFEWIIARVFRKPLIYDFDDAIWTTDQSNESLLSQVARWRRKVRYICTIAARVSCGNSYLCEYARQYNSNVVFMPTTIDTKYHQPQQRVRRQNSIVIGWTGSHSTLPYLTPLLPVIAALQNKFHHLLFRVTANRDPKLRLHAYDFVRWTEQNELDTLATFDIGVMPLPDDDWTKGKCGFKALQYMAMEIPAVVSAVGANREIVDHGINGYTCKSHEEWSRYLELLVVDASQRKKLGDAGRQKVISHYSMDSNAGKFLSLFSVSSSIKSANK